MKSEQVSQPGNFMQWDLVVWDAAMKLNLSIFKIAENITIPWIADQYRAVSFKILNTISEAFHFMQGEQYISSTSEASKSIRELKTMIYLSVELKYILESTGDNLIDECRNLEALLKKMAKSA